MHSNLIIRVADTYASDLGSISGQVSQFFVYLVKFHIIRLELIPGNAKLHIGDSLGKPQKGHIT